MCDKVRVSILVASLRRRFRQERGSEGCLHSTHSSDDVESTDEKKVRIRKDYNHNQIRCYVQGTRASYIHSFILVPSYSVRCHTHHLSAGERMSAR